jgi:vitamin B12 transporter
MSRSCRPFTNFAVTVSFAVLSTAAAAQERAAGDLVINVTRLPTPAEQVGSAVTVIHARDIERRQDRTLAEALEEVPGLNLVRAGGVGGATSVFLRGANSNHTKVLIDGMPANDPTTGTFNFGPLATADIHRIEVLRGPQSALWGADALGGVVNIITRRGEGPPRVNGAVESGSFETFNQLGTVSGSTGPFDYGATAAHLSSGSTPVTPTRLLPAGRARIDDDFESTMFSTKLGVLLADNARLNATLRWSESELFFTGDDFTVFPIVPDAAQSVREERTLTTRLEGQTTQFDGLFEQKLGIGWANWRNHLQSPPAGGTPVAPRVDKGDRRRLDWLGTLHLARHQDLSTGLEYERDALSDSPTSPAIDNRAAFLEVQSGLFDRFFIGASGRVDDNSRFGSIATWRVAPAWLIPETGSRLKASVGTGFKPPTLRQLFIDFPEVNFFANPALQPERSLGWDAGFEQDFFAKRVSFGATWFHSEIRDLIDTNATFTSLVNRNRAETKGVEAFLALRPWEDVALRADYTFTIAQDSDTGAQLLRRPKHRAALEASWRFDELTVSSTVLYVGPRVDATRDFAIPRLRAGGYGLWNLGLAYELTEAVALFARAENVLDRRVEDPIGFERPGFGIFGGIKVSLDGAALLAGDSAK